MTPVLPYTKAMLRKLWHLLGLVFPAVYCFGLLSRRWVLVAAAVATLAVAVVEAVRFASPQTNRTFATLFRRMLRREEYSFVNASLLYLFGTFLVLLLYPRAIACAALFFLGLGDTAAELVGRTFGRVKIFAGKTLEGTLACVAACFGVGVLLLPWPLALVGAVAAAAFELFSPGQTDNFLIGVGSGGAVWLAARLIHAAA